ncbi:MAG: hypothetical protein CMJ46_07750 [Planctomyces sp.]|nr:hypothetical protein [Planctomyces sp.]
MNTVPYKLVGWICVGLLIAAVASSLYMAKLRSTTLKSVKVTFVGEEELRDHDLPLIKQREALPDYGLYLNHRRHGRILLNTHLDQSAKEGLAWDDFEEYSVEDISAVRLFDEDKIISEDLAEVRISAEPVTLNEYQFEFTVEESFDVGLKSFWDTPVGTAVIWSIGIVLLVMIGAAIGPYLS